MSMTPDHSWNAPVSVTISMTSTAFASETRFTTAPKDAAQRRPPLICVHGGCHASWSWQEHAAVYAAAELRRFTPSTGVVAAVRQRSAMTRS